MGTGPNDADLTKTPAVARSKNRPTVWPELQNMPNQFDGANRMFRQNSERLQARQKEQAALAQSQPEKRLTFASDRSAAKLQQIKVEQARTVTSREEGVAKASEKKLTFAMDREAQRHDPPAKSEIQKTGRELTFARDSGSTRGR